MRATYADILLLNLRGEIHPDDYEPFKSPAEAAAELKKMTGQDFGTHPDKWQIWMQQNRPELLFHYHPPASLWKGLRRWLRGA